MSIYALQTNKNLIVPEDLTDYGLDSQRNLEDLSTYVEAQSEVWYGRDDIKNKAELNSSLDYIIEESRRFKVSNNPTHGNTYVKDGIEVVCVNVYSSHYGVYYKYGVDTHDIGYYLNGIDMDATDSYSTSASSTTLPIIFQCGYSGTSGMNGSVYYGDGPTCTEDALSAFNPSAGTSTIWSMLLKLRQERGSDDWFIPNAEEDIYGIYYYSRTLFSGLNITDGQQRLHWTSSRGSSNSYAYSISMATGVVDGQANRTTYRSCRLMCTMDED